MLRKILLVFSFVVAGTLLSYAQTGSLKIKLVDKANRESLPFANVVVEQNGAKVQGGATNMDGEVTFTSISPGKYDVKATFVGYQTLQKVGVIVSVDKATYLNFEMSSAGGVELTAAVVEIYQTPLIDPDTKQVTTFNADDIKHMAIKEINGFAALAPTVSRDSRGDLNIGGSRTDAVTYYVDGVRVQNGAGGVGVSQLGLEQISIITGGIPAQYGDNTGGIISVSTKGAQSKFTGSVQAESSQYLDAFGHNLIGFNIGGPIYSVKDTAGNKSAIVSFNISGEYIYKKDPNPSVIGSYKVKDDVLKKLQDTPLRPSSTGTGNIRNAEFITMNDLEKIQFRQNVAQNGINLSGKIKVKISDNTDLTIGGRYAYKNGYGYDANNLYVYEYALFNAQNNPQRTDNTFSVNTRLTQRFNTKTETEKEKTNAVITNAVYNLQVEYTKEKSITQNAEFKDNFFEYGYVGKFDRIRSTYNSYGVNGPSYTSNFNYSSSKQGLVQAAPAGDSLIRFTPATSNPLGANYTSQYFQQKGTVHNFDEIQSGLGLLNGDRPGNIYSLWYDTGRQYPGYSLTDNDFFRVYTDFSAKVKNHNIQVGFEYEQRIYRGFRVLDAPGLWTLMRNITNKHIEQMDTANPIRVTGMGTYDYIFYNQKYDGATQSQFSKSLRTKLGMPVDGTNFVNTDGLDPSTYKLNMFSADDLLNTGGNQYVTYWGYDYTGKKLSTTPSFDAFFNAKDANNNFARQVGAIQPIYIAGYIQDQFDISDLKFRLGLRVDRFDANTKVLKDKYSLFEVKTAGEVTNLGTHPSNIGNNFVVYVDDPKNPSKVVGYRDADTWYNPQGVQVNNPAVLVQNAGVSKLTPYLVDPNSSAVSSKAFKDYTPQINLMPRIAFAFPISDRAEFNANYDITTQRPPFGTNTPLPMEYLNWAANASQSPFIGNAALQPQRTTRYEVGFKQTLNEKKNAALTISAFYKELRNLIQYRNINAYPSTYLTYDNIDFATVKGFTVAFDLRRTHNVQMGANYTLQFADGTGSNTNDGYNLTTAGVPNLRNLIPLSYDRRHQLNLVLDYRFSSGAEYNGPVWIRHKGEDKESVLKLLQDVGFNLSAHAGSGTPFSRQSVVTQDVAVGLRQGTTLKGSVNGSNLPWTYGLDLKIDKDLVVTFKPEKDGKAAKVSRVNVYVLVLNLLNTQNILSVYKFSGNANDDGFLTSAAGKQFAASQISPTSFKDLYSVKVNDPSNYSLPRTIRIGFIMTL
jgi:hypothetical protein